MWTLTRSAAVDAQEEGSHQTGSPLLKKAGHRQAYPQQRRLVIYQCPEGESSPSRLPLGEVGLCQYGNVGGRAGWRRCVLRSNTSTSSTSPSAPCSAPPTSSSPWATDHAGGVHTGDAAVVHVPPVLLVRPRLERAESIAALGLGKRGIIYRSWWAPPLPHLCALRFPWYRTR